MIKITNEYGNIETYRDYNELFYVKLVERKVNYTELNNNYVSYLQNLEYENKKQLSICDIPLIEILTSDKRNEKYRKDYIARYLKKYGRCDNMPFVEELNEIIEKHNININDDYYINLYNQGGKQ